MLLALVGRSGLRLRTSLVNRSISSTNSSSRRMVAGFAPFKLAQIQLIPGIEDKTAHLEHAREMIIRAASGDGTESQKPDLIMLPEYFNSPIANSAHGRHAELVPDLASTGESIESKDLPTASPTLHMLSQAAIMTERYIIGGSIPEQDPEHKEKIYNTMTAGRMIGKYRKMHLYDVDIPGGITMRESDIISPGSQPVVIKFPFGSVAVAICFDIRFQYLLASIREAHPDICAYLLPAAFNPTTGPKAWEVLQRVRAIDNQIYVGMCSPARRLGDEVRRPLNSHQDSVPRHRNRVLMQADVKRRMAQYVAYGHTLLCDCEGKVISTPTPDDQAECIVFSTLEPAHLEGIRRGVPTLSAERRDVYQPPSLKTA